MLARCGPARGPPWGLLRGGLCLPPRVQKKNQPCLGSLAPSGLCRNTFVPLFGTGFDCTFPLPVPSGPPSFGPQGWLISCPDLREKTSAGTLDAHSHRQMAVSRAFYVAIKSRASNFTARVAPLSLWTLRRRWSSCGLRWRAWTPTWSSFRTRRPCSTSSRLRAATCWSRTRSPFGGHLRSGPRPD